MSKISECSDFMLHQLHHWPLKDDATLYKVHAEVNSPTHISTNGLGNNSGLKP